MWCCADGAVGGGGGGGFWLQVCYTLVMEVGGRKVSAVFRVLFTPQLVIDVSSLLFVCLFDTLVDGAR